MQAKPVFFGFLFMAVTAFAQPSNGVYFYTQVNSAGNFFDKPKMVIDSVQFFYSWDGDTLTYWTTGSTTPKEKSAIRTLSKDKEFGKTIQLGYQLTDGRVAVHRLRPMNFLVRNDSLFQWGDVYKISEDSIQSIVKLYNSTTDTKLKRDLTNLLSINKEEGYVFIFNSALFGKGVTEHQVRHPDNSCSNRIILINSWEYEDTQYYHFDIKNNCGIWNKHWGFTISGNFEFVRFGGYNNATSLKLTSEHSIFSNFKD